MKKKRVIVADGFIFGLVFFISVSALQCSNRELPEKHTQQIVYEIRHPATTNKEFLLKFGNIIQGERIVQKVRFWNHGDREVKINDISNPCDCTYIMSTDEKIKPAGYLDLTFTFDSGGDDEYTKGVKKTFNITLSDGAIYRVSMVGNVTKMVMIAPVKIVIARTKGELKRGENIDYILSFTSIDDSTEIINCMITDDENWGKIFSSTYFKSIVEENSVLTMSLALNRKLEVCKFTTFARLSARVMGENKELYFKISGRIDSDVEHSPSMLYFSPKDRDESLVVKYRGPEPLMITRVDLHGNPLTVKKEEIVNENEYKIEFRHTGSDESAPTGKLHIYNNIDKEPTEIIFTYLNF